ncbi:DUF2169 domain-containing protein [Archangium sp. Cb G35]|uniref:DUF2169 family type VI secretion system accessory protein n=1 Tax=Archangium sp. Cb G35 TaxID=1920190 RepID=UPI001E52E73E|nr:DUF2169 domain-containing protein [Archangium sp. Cb G35]
MDTLYVVVKATFALRGNTLTVAPQQRTLVMADEYWGEPGQSSLKYASEAHLLKPGTDVLLLGAAHAPRGRPTEACLVSVRVGSARQVLQIFGDREWTGGVFSPQISSPEPFTRMPLVWERAFGGTQVLEDRRVLGEERNPVGQGFRGKRSASEMVGRSLPNLEDPHKLISSTSDTPEPVGVGPVAPAWQPRKRFAGTYDEQWQATRAPYLPRDFRPEFFHLAPAALCVPERLKGGEPVELSNVSPQGSHRFALPKCELGVTVRIAGRSEHPPLRLETVLLEPEEGQVCLTWRGSVGCDKQALKVQSAHFQVKSLQGVEE